METVRDFIFLGSKITADGDHSRKLKRSLLLGRKVMTNIDSILKSREEQDGRGVGGHGVHLSPWIHQEYTFRHRSACRTPAESGQEYLTSGKEHTTMQNSVGERTGGKTGVLVGLDLPSVGGGIEAQVQSPHWGNCLSRRRNIYG